MSITGGCLCGAVRYTASTPPIMSRMCFCRVCQYFACGNGAVNAAFRTADVSFTGTMKDFVSIADSGTEMHRRFCPECGVHLTTAAIWMDSAPRWVCLDPSVEQIARQPPPLKTAT